jgi:hypothetical protein
VIIHEVESDLTVNKPNFVNFQKNVSGLLVRCISIKLWTRWSHLDPLIPVKACLKPIFKGVWENTCATETCLCYTMWYREVYWAAKGLFSSQVSSQNEFQHHPLLWKRPLSKNSSLHFNNPFQKGESFGLTVTCDKLLECKYLLWISSLHTPPDLLIF